MTNTEIPGIRILLKQAADYEEKKDYKSAVARQIEAEKACFKAGLTSGDSLFKDVQQSHLARLKNKAFKSEYREMLRPLKHTAVCNNFGGFEGGGSGFSMGTFIKELVRLRGQLSFSAMLMAVAYYFRTAWTQILALDFPIKLIIVALFALIAVLMVRMEVSKNETAYGNLVDEGNFSFVKLEMLPIVVTILVCAFLVFLIINGNAHPRGRELYIEGVRKEAGIGETVQTTPKTVDAAVLYSYAGADGYQLAQLACLRLQRTMKGEELNEVARRLSQADDFSRPEMIVRWLESAVREGSSDAYLSLGKIYSERGGSQNLQIASEYFEKYLAEHGDDREAIRQLAFVFHELNKNSESAVYRQNIRGLAERVLASSPDQGSLDSEYLQSIFSGEDLVMIGDIYAEEGKDEEALAWFQAAAENHDSGYVQWKIGEIYTRRYIASSTSGHYKENDDYRQAKSSLEKAIDLGETRAYISLAELAGTESDMSPEEMRIIAYTIAYSNNPDNTEYAELWKNAVQEYDPEQIAAAGGTILERYPPRPFDHYDLEAVIPDRVSRGLELLDIAMERGSIEGYYYLARYHYGYTGRGDVYHYAAFDPAYGIVASESLDQAQGLALLQEGAALDSYGCEYALGCLYENGKGGCSKDLDQALSWYQKAAEHAKDSEMLPAEIEMAQRRVRKLSGEE